MKQESFYIELGTMTKALRAEKALKEKGIESFVSKSNDKNGGGCVWGVYVKHDDRSRAINIIRCDGISGGVL